MKLKIIKGKSNNSKRMSKRMRVRRVKENRKRK
jgi:hypothetical protein